MYDADGLFLDGNDIRKLNPAWLRRQMAIVSHESRLFDMTIEENIAFGDLNREVSLDEVISAAKYAGAHDFISSLPEVMDHLTLTFLFFLRAMILELDSMAGTYQKSNVKGLLWREL